MATIQTKMINFKDYQKPNRDQGHKFDERMQSLPLTFNERDETEDSVLNDASSVVNQEAMVDDKLTIKFDNQDHFVDTIV
jgi:hypothetical protein